MNLWVLCSPNRELMIFARKKIADLTKTLGTMSPDKNAVMFKISVHDEQALNSFMDGSNPISKPVWDNVMLSYGDGV